MKLKNLLLSSLLAASTMSVSALATGDQNTILINFRTGSGQGIAGIEGTWNEIANENVSGGASGTGISLKFSDGSDASALLSYSAANVWGADRYTDGVLKGYLDDGGASGASISLSTSFLVANVTIYCATDSGAQFTAKTVNGISYTYDATSNTTVIGNTAWGDSATVTATEGKTALTISGVAAGNISISGNAKSGNARGCIAGLKIVNAYTGTRKDVTASGGNITWADATINGVEWTNSTDTAGTYAAFALSNTTDVNVTGTNIITDAIVANGTGTLTLSGNAISLIGPAIIRTDSTSANISINNTFNFEKGGTILGNVSLGSSGALNFKGGHNAVTTSVLNNTGTITLENGATLTTDQNFEIGDVNLQNLSGVGKFVFNAVTGSGGYAGKLKVHLADSFTGEFVMNSNIWLSFASEHSNFGKSTIVLGGDALFHSTTTTTLENNIRFDGRAEIWADSANATVTIAGDVTGTGTAVKKGAGVMDFTKGVSVSTFNQEAGTSNLTGTVNVSTLNVSAGTSNLTGTTTISNLNVTGGTLNAKAQGATATEIRQTGGTINIGDGTASASVTSVNYTGAAYGTTAGTVNIKNNAALTITGNKTGTDAFGHSFQLAHWTAKQTMNIEGVLNLSNVSLGLADGNAEINIASTGEANFNAGLSLAARHGSGATVNLNGGRINVGANGISNDSKLTLKLDSGTLGSLADSWSMGRNLELGDGKTITIDTAKQSYNEGGKATATATPSTITLNGAEIRGNGSLKITGPGTFNYYDSSSGGKTIAASIDVAQGSIYVDTSTWKAANTYSGVLSGAGTVRLKVADYSSQSDGMRKISLNASNAANFTGTLIIEGAQATDDENVHRNELALNTGDGIFGGTIKFQGVNVNGNGKSTDDDSALPNKSVLSLGKAMQIGGLVGNAGNVSLGEHSLTIANGVENEFAGTISGTGALHKTGTGTLVLSGTNSYSGGTTISAGTLIAKSDSALGDSAGTVTISNGAHLQIGESSPLTRSAGSITLQNTAYTIVLDETTNYSDAFAISGPGKIADNSTITINKKEGSVFDLSNTYLIYKGDNLSSVSIVLGEGLSDWTTSITKDGYLVVSIPEPSFFGFLAGMSALALVAGRRRRRK